MTKILYGFSGEGSGHSSRTREMARCLIEAGHEVRLASYDRGYQNLCDDFDILEIEGLSISVDDNRVSKLKTITKNLKKLPAGRRGLRNLRDLFRDFQPDVVITDFEPMTAYLAEHYHVPLITVDNQHRMRYVDYKSPPKRKKEAKRIRRLIRLMIPWPSVSLVIALNSGKIKNDRTFLFSPIVSHDVLRLKPEQNDHTLVYLTSGYDSLLPVLKTYGREKFLVYGYDRDVVDNNLHFKKASRDGFIHDLASAKSVIATAGFTLISESLHLQKPYLAMPMNGQFEQELNAFQLEEMKYGMSMPSVSSSQIGEFFYRLPEYRDALSEYQSDDSSAIKNKLLELVADDGRIAKVFKSRR